MRFNFLTSSSKLQHTAACLMQGLHQLGHEINTNHRPAIVTCNGIYPPFSDGIPSYVQEVDQFKDGLIIADISENISNNQSAGAARLNELNKLSEIRNFVLINMNDSVNFHSYPPQAHVFHGHYNSLLPRKGKTYPMGFGLSDEIITFAKNSINHKPRKLSFVHNFRPSERQGVRQTLMLSLLPNLEKYFNIDTSFTQPADYPNQLISNQAVFCYGGNLYTDIRLNSRLAASSGSEIFDFAVRSNTNREAVVFRFDSWRLYEAALFGAAPITLHFEKYGLETGANPRPWIEYIPVEFDKIESLPLEIASRLKEDPDFLIKVGQNARRWVLDNHSPVATAQRFIRKVQELKLI